MWLRTQTVLDIAMKKTDLIISILWACLLATAVTVCSAMAQTSAFTYQGKLTEAGGPANGTYDLQFKLFNTPTVGTGTQQGSTITNPSVQVSAGNFAVTLDFGANVFDGTARYLEIGVRPTGSPTPHTVLGPRVEITSSPYAIQTLQLGGLPASRYVKSEANGNVAIGTGTPAHRLAVLGGPCWTGDCWGGALELDNASAIAWRANSANVRFGIGRTENGLFFFRTMSPLGTTTDAPIYDFKMDNTGNVGIGNLGISTDLSGAKLNILTGSNSYGLLHSNGIVTVGSFVDSTAGWLGTKSNHPLHFFTNDSLPKMTLDTAGRLGIGIDTPLTPLHVRAFNPILVLESTSSEIGPEIKFRTTFRWWTTGVFGPDQGSNPGAYYIRDDLAGVYRIMIIPGGNVGISTDAPQRLLHVNGRARIGDIPPEASVASVCFNAAGDLLRCGASSLRLKKNVKPFGTGLDIVRRLRPIRFDWREDGRPDIGLGAEDVAAVAPSLTFTNSEGEVTGVKYERLNILLINAIKEQQAQINEQRTSLEQQQTLIKHQQRQLEALTKVICQVQPQAALCQEGKQ